MMTAMTITKIDTVGRLAFETHAVLEARGWCQQSMEEDDGRVCLSGAVNLVAYGEAEPDFTEEVGDYYAMFSPAAEALLNAMLSSGVIDIQADPKLSRENRDLLWTWNDIKGRTSEQIDAALRRVMLDFATTPCDLKQEEAGVL